MSSRPGRPSDRGEPIWLQVQKIAVPSNVNVKMSNSHPLAPNYFLQRLQQFIILLRRADGDAQGIG